MEFHFGVRLLDRAVLHASFPNSSKNLFFGDILASTRIYLTLSQELIACVRRRRRRRRYVPIQSKEVLTSGFRDRALTKNMLASDDERHKKKHTQKKAEEDKNNSLLYILQMRRTNQTGTEQQRARDKQTALCSSAA